MYTNCFSVEQFWNQNPQILDYVSFNSRFALSDFWQLLICLYF